MADMDIDMDLDLGLGDEDMVVQETTVLPDIVEMTKENQAPILTTPNDTSIPNSAILVPEKVHIRGLDDLTTKDIKTFATEHFAAHEQLRIEWIDDTSANLVYESAEIAKEALIAFAAIDAASISQVTELHSIPAKAFSSHPESNLRVRLAVLGDRKLAGARDRSRFYLFNPEYDPGERQRQGGHGRGNRYRDRDEGGYHRQKYDDREQRKRQDDDADAGFDASLYDDDESALAKRSARNKPRDLFDGYSRPRSRGRAQGGSSKELFPDRDGEKGRLRDRSASPMRENEWESRTDDIRLLERKRDMAAAANREKAQLMKTRLKEASEPKELFPSSKVANNKHQRPDGLNAADEAADLFSDRMTVPFMDDDGEDRPTLASRVTIHPSKPNIAAGFNIRGAAKASQPQSFNIKGAAGNVKELFPATLGSDNSGKELFSGRLEGRGRRQRAGDLFD